LPFSHCLVIGALTTPIQVDCMTKITTSRNPSKKRRDRCKSEKNRFRSSSHCLEPIGKTVSEHISSSFSTNDGEALSKLKNEISGKEINVVTLEIHSTSCSTYVLALHNAIENLGNLYQAMTFSNLYISCQEIKV